MKSGKHLRKWMGRLAALSVVIVCLLLAIVLNPFITYGFTTTVSGHRVYHNQPLMPCFKSVLREADALARSSEWYPQGLELDICLNDGSFYPSIIRACRGKAFAWGFYNKVVLQGIANSEENYVQLSGYKWNFSQLLAHEMVHCIQFHQLGLIKSNPIANIPEWKWEGYAEYIARQAPDQKKLLHNIERLRQSAEADWGIKFDDGTIAPRSYYEYWNLVKYCMEIKGMNCQKLLQTPLDKNAVYQEMMVWYNREKGLSK